MATVRAVRDDLAVDHYLVGKCREGARDRCKPSSEVLAVAREQPDLAIVWIPSTR
jgi:hypothetical protein